MAASQFSSTGKKVFAAYAVIILLNVIVIGLSARVNHFQQYFYVADIFPLALSITTLVISVLMLLLDVGFDNAFTARAPFEIGMLILLSIFWLAFNAFSTSRWRHIPLNCSAIPSDYDDVVSWCKDLQALKAFVWIDWVAIFGAALIALRYTVLQSQRGQKHIWRTPLSRFARRAAHQRNNSVTSGMTQVSDFLRFSH
ncbi:hypothetical protein FA95DRAFT_1554413 [Auriscalpium vulgare]|uniref:Uncharacterized protein n=1 Tax=Auriscalpium vulgare TaxID=40419 RepID=A0ACB8S6Q6_9AGAM|nr:hypothetical protein FA95DRAFT_1554413 [Auriscalpium vulgare]